MRHTTRYYSLLSLCLAAIAAAFGAPTPVKTIPLGPQPAFILPVTEVLAPSSNRLYVFNSSWDGFTVASPSIAVIDTSTNTFISRLQPPIASGMSIVEATSQRSCAFANPATNKIYAAYSNSTSGMIVVIDGATDTISQTVTVPGGITNMAFNPATNKIYVAQFSTTSPTQLLVYDVNTLVQLASIGGVDNGGIGGVSGPPLAVNPANNKIYTAAPGSSVLVIDGTRDVTEAFISVGAEVGELKLNPVNNRVYVGFSSPPQTVWVVDGASDQLAATISSTSTLFGAFTVDPLRNIVYSSMGNGFQIDGATNTLEFGPVYGNFAPPVNVDCASIFLGTADFSLHNWYAGCDGNVLIADSATGSYKNTISVSYVTMWGLGIFNPANHLVYMLSTFNNSVTALDPVSLKATLIQLGNVPIGIAANPVTNRVYVADGPSNAAVAIDGGTNNVLAKVFAQTQHPGMGATLPVGIAVNSATNRYVFSQQWTAVELDGGTNSAVVNINPGNKGSGIPNPRGFNFASVNTATNKMYTSDRNTVYLTDLVSGAFGPLATAACNIGGLTVASASNLIYVSETCQAGGLIEVYNGTSGAPAQSMDVSAFIPATSTAGSIALNPKTSKLYIVNSGAGTPNTVEVFNAVTLAHLATIANVGGTLAVNTVLNAIYGTFTGAGAGAAVIDGATDTLSSTFGAGIVVSGIAANEATNMIYVGDSVQGTVNVFQGDAPSPGAFSISGRVVSGTGAGVAGVTIASRGVAASTTVTDLNGLFTLTGIQAGTYTISPTSTGYFYGPASQTVSVTTTSVTGVSFDALTTAIAVTGLTLSPWTTIGPGVTTTATVTINQPAPPGGVVLNISASNTKPAKFPSTVTVPAGSTSATFSVQGNSVGAVTPTTVTATYQGSFAPAPSSASVNLAVSPSDSLHVLSATWSKSTQILSVSATSTNPQSILQLFLASTNQLLGTFTNQGNGNYSIQVSFTSGTPASANVKSNLGGSTGQGVAVTP